MGANSRGHYRSGGHYRGLYRGQALQDNLPDLRSECRSANQARRDQNPGLGPPGLRALQPSPAPHLPAHPRLAQRPRCRDSGGSCACVCAGHILLWKQTLAVSLPAHSQALGLAGPSGAALKAVLAKSLAGVPPALLMMMPDTEDPFTKRFPSPTCSVVSLSNVRYLFSQAHPAPSPLPPLTEVNKPSPQVEPFIFLGKPKRTDLAEPYNQVITEGHPKQGPRVLGEGGGGDRGAAAILDPPVMQPVLSLPIGNRWPWSPCWSSHSFNSPWDIIWFLVNVGGRNICPVSSVWYVPCLHGQGRKAGRWGVRGCPV